MHFWQRFFPRMFVLSPQGAWNHLEDIKDQFERYTCRKVETNFEDRKLPS